MIVRDPVKYHDNMSVEFKSFLQGLLYKSPSERLSWPGLLDHPLSRKPTLRIMREKSTQNQKTTIAVKLDYLATDSENFYIVYGTHVHHTSDLNNNTNPSDFALQPKLVEFLPFTYFSGDLVSLKIGPSDHPANFKFGVNKTLSDSFTTTSSDPA